MDVLQQSNNLRNGFITYLQLKQAAGIVNVCHPTSDLGDSAGQPSHIIHIFPPCPFTSEQLLQLNSPELIFEHIAYLFVVICSTQ